MRAKHSNYVLVCIIKIKQTKNKQTYIKVINIINITRIEKILQNKSEQNKITVDK